MMQELKLLGKECPIPRAGCNFLQYDKGKYLVIGGVNRSVNGLQELNDFWTLHLPLTDSNLAGIWKELNLENQQIYTPRSSQAACITDNYKIYIFGGQKFLDSQSTDEFFCIDPLAKVLKIVKSKNTPKGRNSHTLTYFNNKLYLFGGADDKGPLSDFHIFDLESEIWQSVEDVSDLIMAREMHSCHIVSLKVQQLKQYNSGSSNKVQKIISVFDELNNINQSQQKEKNEEIYNIAVKQQQLEEEIPLPQQCEQNILFNHEEEKQTFLLVIGGRHKNDILQDISAINLSTKEVVQVENLPTVLCAHTSVEVNQKIYIFGGFQGNQLNQNIYEFENQTLKTAGTLQSAIMASSALYSKEINKIVIFGGCTLEKDLNQTYVVKI